jgi:hypothetical protein
MIQNNFRRGIVRDVDIVDGSPVCMVEDRDSLDREYPAVVLTDLPEGVILPPIESEVLLSKFKGVRAIVGILSTPRQNPSAKDNMITGAENGHGSVSYTFGPREGASGVEEFSINYTGSGYEITADVDSTITLKTDGDIRLEAGGDIVIEEGGTAKPVLTEDATFEYEDTGDTSDGTASAQTKTTTTVSNGESTNTKID